MNDADNTTRCANCGKGEESCGDLKACTACKLVKYCNRECQIAHRPLHKACKKRAAELHDGALFKEHPPREECPICLLPLPLHAAQISFKTCCVVNFSALGVFMRCVRKHVGGRKMTFVHSAGNQIPVQMQRESNE